MEVLRANLSQFLRHYFLALQTFTRLPMAGAIGRAELPTDLPAEAPQAVAAHLPGVGLLVGIAACFAFAVVSLGLPGRPLNPLAAAFACTIATALLTGALHEAGFARVVDGLGDGAHHAHAPQVLPHPRTGSHGTVALVLVLGLKLSLLAVIAGESAAGIMAALLAGHVVSRYWPLLTMHMALRGGDPGSAGGAVLTRAVDQRALVLAALWCVVPLALLGAAGGGVSVLLALGVSGLAWYGMHQLLLRRPAGRAEGGRDATQQVCEIAFYLGTAFGLGR